MAPPVTEAGKPPPKKFLGLSTGGLIIVGLVAVGAAAFLLWRRSQANAAAATQTGTSTAGTPAGTTYPDWSGEISVMQTEIGDLQGALAEEEQDLAADEKAERTEDQHHRRHRGGDNDHDADDRKARCPKGYHFMPVPANSDLWPAGGRRVKGGFCVPDHLPKRRGAKRRGIRNPVPVSPRR